MLILVREEDADEARGLIAEQRQAFSVKSGSAKSLAEDDVTAEIPIIEEPPPKRDGVAVEIEGDGPVEVGAVDAGSRVGEASENFGAGQAEGIS